MTKKELKFKSQICTTIEQSKRLLELGLKSETADMAHIAFGGGGMMIRPYNWVSTTEVDINNFYPAWSLHRLIEIMDVYEVVLDLEFDIYECVISMLEDLIKDGLINRKYLKQ